MEQWLPPSVTSEQMTTINYPERKPIDLALQRAISELSIGGLVLKEAEHLGG